MARHKTHRRAVTDKQLLASAWSELRSGPAVIHPGRSSSARTAPFSARYRGLCARCGRWINQGDEIRYHHDFDGPVHSGCRAPEVTVTTIGKVTVAAGTQGPSLCLDCHLEHAGDCW
jgi:hypothetical protein